MKPENSKGVDDKLAENKPKPRAETKVNNWLGLKHVVNRIARLPKPVIFGGAIGLLVVIALIVWLVIPKDEPASATPVIQEPVAEIEPEPEIDETPTAISPLTGMEVEESLAQRPVTGIMIENSLVARPQSGLLEAGVVFEAIAESGITRFLALYQESRPDYIGPVRSSRPYYVEWLAPFNASYAHVGGDVAGRAAIAAHIDRDIDQYYYAGTYWRIRERYAPHNVYTSFDRIDEINTSRGFTTSQFEAWPRQASEPAETLNAKQINLSISSSSFNPRYDYDQESNSYKRSLNGIAHTDERSGNQISPKVVIAMKISGYGYDSGVDGPRYRYNHIGSGEAWVFQNGTVIKGTWQKTSAKAQLKFLDANGESIVLAPGQTWISAVKGVSWQ